LRLFTLAGAFTRLMNQAMLIMPLAVLGFLFFFQMTSSNVLSSSIYVRTTGEVGVR
jgi:hypothetical protein